MLDIGRSAIDVELQLPLSELGAALGLPLTSTPDRVVPQYADRIERYVTERMQVHSADGRPYALRIESQVGEGTTAVMTVPNLRGESAPREMAELA